MTLSIFSFDYLPSVVFFGKVSCSDLWLIFNPTCYVFLLLSFKLSSYILDPCLLWEMCLQILSPRLWLNYLFTVSLEGQKSFSLLWNPTYSFLSWFMFHLLFKNLIIKPEPKVFFYIFIEFYIHFSIMCMIPFYFLSG